MMWSTLLLAGGLCLGQIEVVVDDVEPPKEAQGALDVIRLTRQLDAERLVERDEAEAALIAMGPKILELLPETTPRTSAEVVERLGRVRQTLERQQASEAVRASVVSLAGEMSLAEALASLEKQTGIKIRVKQQMAAAEPTDEPLSLDLTDVPFWEALDTVLDQAEYAVYPYAEEGIVEVAPRPEGMLPRVGRASYGGPFRVEPVQVNLRRDLRTNERARLRLDLEVSWEPHISPVTLLLPLDQIQASSPDGTTLSLPGGTGELEAPIMPGSWTTELSIVMEAPPAEVNQIERIEGKLKAIVVGELQSFQFDKLEGARDIKKRKGGVTVTLERVEKNQQLWELVVRTEFDKAGDAMASHRTWATDNPAYLETADGAMIESSTVEMRMQTEEAIGMAYLFYLEKPISNFSFVYKTPLQVFFPEFEFELEGIELR